MDVKVINKQITFYLKHFLVKFKSQTYMYEVDAQPLPPQAVYFHLKYILTKLGDARLLILVTRYETIKGQSSIYFRTVFLQFYAEYGYYGNKRMKVTNYNMIHDKLPKEGMYKRKFSLALEEFS